jgi:putative redox protein
MMQPDVNRVEVVLSDRMRFEARDERGATAILDAAPPGGDGSGMTPMEFLLAGLGGCTAMDVISILRKKRQVVTDYRLEITGSRALTHPQPYSSITIRYVLTGFDIAEEAVRQAIELSVEKYCPAHAMLSKSATISTTFEVRSEQAALVSP